MIQVPPVSLPPLQRKEGGREGGEEYGTLDKQQKGNREKKRKTPQ